MSTKVSKVYTLPYLSGGFPLVLLVLLLGMGAVGEDIELDVLLLESVMKTLSSVLAGLSLELTTEGVLSSR